MRQILSPVFAIGTLHIGNVEGASCVNLGNNWPSNFRSYKKHNQGFGNVTGNNNVMSSLRSLLNDPDTYDMLSSADNSVPAWAESFLQEPTEEEPTDEESSAAMKDGVQSEDSPQGEESG